MIINDVNIVPLYRLSEKRGKKICFAFLPTFLLQHINTYMIVVITDM